MKARILGVGGYENSGLAGNAFIIDGTILCEAPPDILQSLAREGLQLGDLEAVFLSHSHGDHIFGMPFLLFNLAKSKRRSERLKIIGPPDIQGFVHRLIDFSIHKGHPLNDWVEANCAFEIADEGRRLDLGDYAFEFYRTAHEKETYGFGLRSGGELKLQYIPDTRWDESLRPVFMAGSRVILCDVNGTGGNNKIHLSAAEIEANLPAFDFRRTRIYGTHLARDLGRRAGRILIARPGMTIRS